MKLASTNLGLPSFIVVFPSLTKMGTLTPNSTIDLSSESSLLFCEKVLITPLEAYFFPLVTQSTLQVIVPAISPRFAFLELL